MYTSMECIHVAYHPHLTCGLRVEVIALDKGDRHSTATFVVLCSLFFVLVSESLTIKRMLATWLPCTWASVPYGTHISVFASSLTYTQSQSKPVSGGATEQDSDISQRMSSPTLLSEPEIIVQLRFLTVNDDRN